MKPTVKNNLHDSARMTSDKCGTERHALPEREVSVGGLPVGHVPGLVATTWCSGEY